MWFFKFTLLNLPWVSVHSFTAVWGTGERLGNKVLFLNPYFHSPTCTYCSGCWSDLLSIYNWVPTNPWSAFCPSLFTNLWPPVAQSLVQWLIFNKYHRFNLGQFTPSLIETVVAWYCRFGFIAVQMHVELLYLGIAGYVLQSSTFDSIFLFNKFTVVQKIN